MNLRTVFPFSAVYGQPLLCRALLVNALCPRIGGVLLRGQKGTAKSTAVRALAQLMTQAGWGALIELPLSATEDRITGALDLQAALRNGQRRFQPGLLAAAHRGLLYVDEVNLLPDHLTDILLDAAASGVNRVSREGCTVEHAAVFALVGSMNPEEGELRPQLLDRFGLCVDVLAPLDVPTRLEILRRRTDFDSNPEVFLRHWQKEQQTLLARLQKARLALPGIRVPEARLRDAARLSAEAHCAGHRGELALLRTAQALAALDEMPEVRDEHVLEAAALALLHRKRMVSPASAPQTQQSPQKEQHEETQQEHSAPEKPENAPPSPSSELTRQDEQEEADDLPAPSSPPVQQGQAQEEEQIFSTGNPYAVKPLQVRKDRVLRSGSGRHSRSRTAGKCGRVVGYSMQPLMATGMGKTAPDLALEPTLRAAVLRQCQQGGTVLPLCVTKDDWRYKKRERKLGNLIVFAVDASGSMGAASRMNEAKSAVLSLLLHAYQKRDQVALVAFRGQEGKVLLEPTGSVELACKCLEELPTGGRTPLAGGLSEAKRIIHNTLRKNAHTRPILLLISDGRANVTPPLWEGAVSDSVTSSALQAALTEAETLAQDKRIHSLVVDVERGGLLQFGQARVLAEALCAEYVPVEEVRAATLLHMVGNMTGSTVQQS